MVSLSERGLEVRQAVKANNPSFCVFEHIYFSRPDTRLEGASSSRSAAGWARSSGARRRSRPTW